MKAKNYLQTFGIQDETIYDNAERMHSLECLLEDFLQENQAKNNEVLDLVSLSDLVKLLKSDSVRTLLRYGYKNPDRSGAGDSDDNDYIKLYNIVNKL